MTTKEEQDALDQWIGFFAPVLDGWRITYGGKHASGKPCSEINPILRHATIFGGRVKGDLYIFHEVLHVCLFACQEVERHEAFVCCLCDLAAQGDTDEC